MAKPRMSSSAKVLTHPSTRSSTTAPARRWPRTSVQAGAAVRAVIVVEAQEAIERGWRARRPVKYAGETRYANAHARSFSGTARRSRCSTRDAASCGSRGWYAGHSRRRTRL